MYPFDHCAMGMHCPLTWRKLAEWAIDSYPSILDATQLDFKAVGPQSQFKIGILVRASQVKYNFDPERKEQKGENSDFFVFGPNSRGRQFWPDILGNNVESSLNLNNLLSNKYPISMFDLTK